MARSDDFVYTIEDDDVIEDLENERAGELNSEFVFGDANSQPAVANSGWDFGGSTEQAEDQLDVILRRHGGLSSSKDESQDNEAVEASESRSDDSDVSDREGEEPSEDEKKEEESQKKAESEFYDQNPAKSVASYTDMSLSRPVQRGIGFVGYTQPTAIQGAVIPVALLGKDIVAGAQTGSGKTAAYIIPILERLVYRPQRASSTRVIILTPTRELAMQVYDVGRKLGKFVQNLRFGLAVGGLNLRQQEQELKTRPDIVVATPGRFIDHVRNSPSFSVDTVEILVVDEADRMLEEGFEAELTEILTLIPSKRQTLLFSATMNSSIKDLVRLSLHKPARIMIDPPRQAAQGLIQEFVRIRKQYEQSRPAILVSLLRKLGNAQRVIVFVTRKATAHYIRVVAGLLGIKVGELHGSLTQEQRLNSITAFRSMDVPILICTDLAARGLDIPKIGIVLNYELPSTYDVYLHRVGRTARAGRTGTAISLVGESTSERQVVKAAVTAAQAAATTQKQKILGRSVDWDDISSVVTEIDVLKSTIDEVFEEEKTAKEIDAAEREITRAQNIAKHKDEIAARPKRTWFESEQEKAQSRRGKAQKPKTNHQKKLAEAGKQNWAYKKTKDDRTVSHKRGSDRVIQKHGVKRAKT